MFFDFRELLSLLTVSPATENTRSDGVDVAGIFNIHLATFESCGNLFSFSFHQVRGFAFLFITFSAKPFLVNENSSCACLVVLPSYPVPVLTNQVHVCDDLQSV